MPACVTIGNAKIYYRKSVDSQIFPLFCGKRTMVRKRWKEFSSLHFFWLLTDWTIITICFWSTAEPQQGEKKKKTFMILSSIIIMQIATYINLKAFANIKRFTFIYLLDLLNFW